MVDQVPNVNGVDSQGFSVEDFGLSKNLMMAARWAGEARNFEDALKLIVKHAGL